MGVKFNPFTGNFAVTNDALATELGDKYVRTTRFEIINSGTSGTVTLPSNSTVILDDFGGTVDAIITEVSGGKPLLSPAKTTALEVIATTFDSSGNWSFTGTPSAYPVAILYRVRQTLVNFDSTAANIFGNSNIEKDSDFLDNVTLYGADRTGTVSSNSAFLAAIAAHGSAYVPSGTYSVGDLQITSGKIYGTGTLSRTTGATHALILKGTNSEVNGITFASTGTTANGNAEINLGDGCVDAVVRDCKFIGSLYATVSGDTNGSNDTSLVYTTQVNGFHFEQNKVSGAYSRHVYLHNVKNIRIVNNHFKDSLRDSVRLRQATEKCLISGNIFDDIGEENTGIVERPDNWSSILGYSLGNLVGIPTGASPGIYECVVATSTIGANPTTTGAAEWTNINTHYFETKDAVDTHWSGVELIITNNIINRTAQFGLDIKGSDPAGAYSTGRVIISNNLIQNCFGCGINLSSADLLADTTYKASSEYLISNNYLKGNNREQYDVAQSPIRLYQGIENCIVSNNMIVENFARGITVSNASETAEICRNISITGNHIYSNGIPGGVSNIGINCSATESLIIQGNVIKNLPGSTVQTLGMNIKDYDLVGATEFITPRMTTIIRDNITTGNAASDRYEVLLNNFEFPSLLAYVDSTTASGTVVTPLARTMFANGADSGSGSHLNTQAYIINQSITLKARRFGAFGNLLSYEIRQPVTVNQILAITIAPAIYGGQEIIVRLPTDGSGNPVNVTRAELEAFLRQKLGQGILLYENNGSQDHNATPIPVHSVAGKIGAVTLIKDDVSLSNVDNTSDLSKPISTLTQAALNKKAAMHPSNGIELYDNFVSGTSVGNLGWTLFTNSGGIGANLTYGGTSNMGIARFNTVASATAAPTISLGSGASIILGANTLTMEYLIKLPLLSTGAEEFIVRVGAFAHTTATLGAHGVYLEYDRTLSDNWKIVSRRASVQSDTTTSTAVVAGSWIKVKLVTNAAATAVDAYVDDVLIGTLTATLPNGTGNGISPAAQLVKTVGTSTREFLIDWFYMNMTYGV